MASTGERRRDPYQGYRFKLSIDGIQAAGFRECSGLDSTQDPVEYREGDEGPTVRKLAGLVKYSNITLKRGIVDNTEMWDWRKNIMDGNIGKNRKNATIHLYDDANQEVMHWDFTNAWATKWSGPTFNATSNEVAIETLEFAHEGMVRTK